MIKKISVKQLKPGVFVHDFNSGWLHHPFLRNQVKLATDADIEKIIRHQIREVYIDTDRGLDVDDAPTQQEVTRGIQSEINHLHKLAVKSASQVSLKEEFAGAKLLISEVQQSTKRLMEDVRLGKPVDFEKTTTIVDKMTHSIMRNKDALISLARIKTKDEYTYMHSVAVSALCIVFAHQSGFGAKEVKQIGVGGMLHDIGKVKIPSEILNKPGPLTEQEFEIMKQHVTHGDCILRETTKVEENSIRVTAHHHERLDGTGYPDGLKGDEISQFGQMAAIVDIYDALTSERCYKNAIPPTLALRKLYEWSPTYLNRKLVEKFIIMVGIYPIGSLVRLDSGLIGVVIDQGEKGLLSPTVRTVYDTRKKSMIAPRDIDLSRRSVFGSPDDIVSCEAPDQWNLQPEQYLSP